MLGHRLLHRFMATTASHVGLAIRPTAMPAYRSIFSPPRYGYSRGRSPQAQGFEAAPSFGEFFCRQRCSLSPLEWTAALAFMVFRSLER